VLRDENKAREQMKKRSPREAESWRLLEHVSALGQIPAVGLCIGNVCTSCFAVSAEPCLSCTFLPLNLSEFEEVG
jgi:hypothetical protein